MTDAISYKVLSSAGAFIRAGAVPRGEHIAVDRIAGERLYVYTYGEYDREDDGESGAGGTWIEQGAYAGPGAVDAQPVSAGATTGDWLGQPGQPVLGVEPPTAPWSHFKTSYAGDATSSNQNILQEAEAAVYGDREKMYGHPRDDFARIAALWNGYLAARANDCDIGAEDVACMMALLKMARLIETPRHRDSWVDFAGYAAAGARAVGVDA